uniref:Ig-like domain-containing protein n=1 Tax=Anabas testudineus TaxID=64144 RepID=A0A3Q1JQ18_ANATE
MFCVLYFSFFFSSTVTRQLSSYFTVRDGDDVTLPCKHVKRDQDKCQKTEWFFNDPQQRRTDLLFRSGKIESKSDRLSVTENCSLVIKKVTDEDVGRYICRNKSQPKSEDGLMYLFVVNSEYFNPVSQTLFSQQNSFDRVGFTCSVLGYGDCRHSVKWFHQRTMITDLVTSQNNCSVTEYFMHTSVKYESLKCEVTDSDTGSVHQFPLRPPSSGEKTGERLRICSRLKPPMNNLMDLKF